MTRCSPTRVTCVIAMSFGFAGFAQAESRLSLEGVVDVAWVHARSGDGVHRSTLESGQASTSRVGLRGSEDLGRGLRAIFHLEAGFDADTGRGAGSGGSLAFNRQSWVGLDGDWGRMTAGRQYRPETRVALDFDPFDGSSFASPPNTYSVIGFRASNSLALQTARWAGWSVKAMVAAGESSLARQGGNEHGGSIDYRGDAWRFGWGQGTRRNAAGTAQQRSRTLGLSWRRADLTWFGVVRQRREGPDLDQRSGWVGVVRVHERLSLRASLGWVDDRRDSAAGAMAASLGAEVALSPRTAVYARAAWLRNEERAGFDLGTEVDGPEPSALALGLRHRF